MDLSTRSYIIDSITEFMVSNGELFEPYADVYLFGSLLDCGKEPNDIDMLLVYTENSNAAVENMNIISGSLSRICGLSVDLTVLSAAEEKNTQFLKRLGRYSRLK